jgi:hypothetical protein
MGRGLTRGSLFRYLPARRETMTNNPARNEALRVDSSGMVQWGEEETGVNVTVLTLVSFFSRFR